MRFALAGLSLLAGCGACASPVVEGGEVVAVAPTPEVRLEWARMERCVGRMEPVERWRWYVIEGPWFREVGKPGALAGLTVHDRRSIYLAAPFARDTLVLRHEILHALGLWHAPVFGFCGAGVSHLAWWYR